MRIDHAQARPVAAREGVLDQRDDQLDFIGLERAPLDAQPARSE